MDRTDCSLRPGRIVSAAATFLAVAAVAIGLAACLPTARHPLSDPGRAEPDARLFGLWRGTVDEGKAYIHFLPRFGDTTDVLLVMSERDHDADWMVFEMFPTPLDGRAYMNLRPVASGNGLDEDDPGSYLIARYEIGPNGALNIWTMDEDRWAEAIAAGTIRGEVVTGSWTQDVKVTATTPELAAFVSKANVERLFANHFAELKRAD